jgi:hypothetical protein
MFIERSTPFAAHVQAIIRRMLAIIFDPFWMFIR